MRAWKLLRARSQESLAPIEPIMSCLCCNLSRKLRRDHLRLPSCRVLSANKTLSEFVSHSFVLDEVQTFYILFDAGFCSQLFDLFKSIDICAYKLDTILLIQIRLLQFSLVGKSLCLLVKILLFKTFANDMFNATILQERVCSLIVYSLLCQFDFFGKLFNFMNIFPDLTLHWIKLDYSFDLLLNLLKFFILLRESLFYQQLA